MAHRFSNFADAYAYLDSRWSVCRSNQTTAYGLADDAIDYATAGQWENGIKFCAYAIQATLTAFDILFECYNHDLDYSVHGECFYWASKEGGDGEVTMSMILDAMWDAKPHQCLLFIPMIDAMRGAIQQKTVTSQYMADALRHFME